MASAVGSTTNLTLRSLASRFTSSMTGRRPYPSADDQARALPRNVFFRGQRRVAKRLAELLGRLFLPSVDLASIDDKVAFVGHSVDIDRTELKMSEPHCSHHTPASFS